MKFSKIYVSSYKIHPESQKFKIFYTMIHISFKLKVNLNLNFNRYFNFYNSSFNFDNYYYNLKAHDSMYF